MRSRLLLSVAPLPTIRETSEEMLPPGGLGQEPPASPSLDDYVRSICQLAQPTCVLDKATVQDGLSGPHRPAWGLEETCPTATLQDSTAHFGAQQPPRPTAGPADPLDWLFGESQEKQSSRREPARRTGASAGLGGLHRQTDSGKTRAVPRGKLCEARAPGHSLVRTSRDGPQSANLRSHMAGRPSRATDSSYSPRPSSILRTFYLHLPVIHEL
ncbi:protein DEPP1 [Oryctolagus cuniculus]|uniref:protein DEPP1 n=1 Tax=Oryctolagus cuniculus TaxID=9986 RepID=UPI003879612B